MKKNTSDLNIEKLLEIHGKRIKPNDLMKKRAMKNVKAHWQSNIANQHTKRQTLLFRIAASFVLLIGVVFLVQNNLNDSSSIIIKEYYANGEIKTSKDGINWTFTNQEPIFEDIWIRTNDTSFVNLTLLDNSQLRLNHDTQIHLISPTKIVLTNGEIYHDADNINTVSHLDINTSLGNIQHIGTRYLIKKTDTELHVSVRNGLVKVENNAITKEVESGKQIILDTLGNYHETDILSYDSVWGWTQDAGQPFQSKGKSLNDFIKWFAHENGYQIDWNSLESKTKRVKLTGDISNLNSSIQIKTIFLSTKFDYQINQGILSIL